jgi:nucleoside 2-deoxyribosyltransferase
VNQIVLKTPAYVTVGVAFCSFLYDHIFMQALIAIKYYEDGRKRELIEAISAALESNGIKTVNILRDYEEWGTKHFTPQELMALTFQEINKSDFLLIELSEKGVGLGIEAGYAYAKGVPIVIIAKAESDISSTLQGVAAKIIFYNNASGLADRLNFKFLSRNKFELPRTIRLIMDMFKKRNKTVPQERERFLHMCAWCRKEIPPDVEVFVVNAKAKLGIDLTDKQGTCIELNASVAGTTVPAFVATEHSVAKRQGYDLVLMTCTEKCAESLRMVLAAEKHLFDGIVPGQPVS